MYSPIIDPPFSFQGLRRSSLGIILIACIPIISLQWACTPGRLERKLSAHRDNSSADSGFARQELEPRLSVRLEQGKYIPVYLHRKDPAFSDAINSAFQKLNNRDASEMIALLENELKNSSLNDPLLLSDLAAAYLVKGDKESSFSDLIHALSITEQVISTEPKLAAAHYNRALVLEKIHLLNGAHEAWKVYLELEETAEWAEKVKAHLIELPKLPPHQTRIRIEQSLDRAAFRGKKDRIARIVKRHPHIARMHAIEYLLPKWAKSSLEGHEEDATRFLQEARAIGSYLQSLQNDKYILEAVSAIEAASRSEQSQNTRSVLITAHMSLDEGRRLLKKNEIKFATVKFEMARKTFEMADDKAGETMAVLLSTIWETDYNKSIANLNHIREIAEYYGFPYMLGRAWRGLGSKQGFRFETAQALDSQITGLKYLESVGDSEGATTVNYIISDILSQIGDKKEIWQYQQKALAQFDTLSEAQDREKILSGIASQLQKLGEDRAALYFHNESVKSTLEKDDPLMISFTLQRRSITHQKLGNLSAASADLISAREQTRRFPDKKIGNLFQYELSIIEGDNLLSDNPAKSIRIFNHVISSHSKMKNRYYRIHLFRSRAKAYLALGDTASAERDLKEGIDEIERDRNKVVDSGQKMDFFETTESLYEEMIKLLMQKKRKAEAFNYVERAKARALLASVYNGGLKDRSDTDSATKGMLPLRIDNIKKELPPDQVLIEYAVLKDRLFVWIVRQDGAEALEIPVGSNSIENLASDFRNALEGRSSSVKLGNLSASVYDILFRPIAKLLPKNALITIVPDKALYDIPFAALFDSATGHYLLERHVITYAPSATLLIHCLRKDGRLALEDDRSALIVGNPAFDQSLFPELKDLKWAETEATQIRDLYSSAFELLLAETATKGAFNEEIEHFSIIHFAGHAIENVKFPLYSQLVFALPSDADSPGNVAKSILYAHELYGRQLEHTRLVVLAACRTASGQHRAGEGPISFVRAFLAAGVPAVIASLWNANDRASAKLFISFHSHLVKGKDANAALNLAQLELLRDKDPALNSPAAWGAFVLSGGKLANRL
jgi:CHAT domain-containing protein